MPPPIIRATCVFDTKFDGFFGWPIPLSAYKEMNKKIFEFSDFCRRVSAFLIEIYARHGRFLFNLSANMFLAMSISSMT